MSEYRNPVPTVDVVVVNGRHIVMVKRKKAPHGWALPGGFVNEGESLEAAAAREIKEETGLDVTLREQFFTYSKPDRDPRRHVMTTVFIGHASGEPVGADDAADARWFLWNDLPEEIAFDHRRIIEDVIRYQHEGVRGRRKLEVEP